MKENVGRVDQVARGLAGPALIGLGYRRLGGRRGRMLGLAAMMGGALVVESAVTRVCPLSALLGIDSRSQAERARDRKAVLASEARIDATQPPSAQRARQRRDDLASAAGIHAETPTPTSAQERS
jgi:hypothetical protein